MTKRRIWKVLLWVHHLGQGLGLRCDWPCPIGTEKRLERDALSRQYGLGRTRVEGLSDGGDRSEVTAAKRQEKEKLWGK